MSASALPLKLGRGRRPRRCDDTPLGDCRQTFVRQVRRRRCYDASTAGEEPELGRDHSRLPSPISWNLRQVSRTAS